MQQDTAEVLALKVLGWLAGNDELMPIFLGSTGMDSTDLIARAQDANVLASVLDFLMLDDEWVRQWASDTAQDPELIMRARMSLPGGQQVSWT